MALCNSQERGDKVRHKRRCKRLDMDVVRLCEDYAYTQVYGKSKTEKKQQDEVK